MKTFIVFGNWGEVIANAKTGEVLHYEPGVDALDPTAVAECVAMSVPVGYAERDVKKLTEDEQDQISKLVSRYGVGGVVGACIDKLDSTPMSEHVKAHVKVQRTKILRALIACENRISNISKGF